MPAPLTRIFSDIHFGDRASNVHQLAQLDPLLDGVHHLVLNGDTLDTRPSEDPLHTQRCRVAVAEYFARRVARVTFVTGNHDADFSPCHHLDLAAGDVFAIHGDICFPNLVPWSRDAPIAAARIEAGLAALDANSREDLDRRLEVFRRVAMTLPQRHQSEHHSLRYTLRYLADTVWPPHRFLLVMHAWRVMPRRALALRDRYRPRARFVVNGHTHQPGVWRLPEGVTVINTGSFTLPLGAFAVDLSDSSLRVRRISRRGREFHPDAIVAEFALAAPA
ncbi:MAG: metallophosphoesterase family protein [Verrucomicrobia bacterium]|nr:metallophosphoesterase family protein [Verrucomicrobiota bacterium]